MTNVDYKRAVELRKKSLKEHLTIFAAKLIGVHY